MHGDQPQTARDALGNITPDQRARNADYSLALLQGVNDVPRAVTGLLTAGMWQDTNPFVQTNNKLDAVRSGYANQYDKNAVDELVQWGIREAPQIATGAGLAKTVDRLRAAANAGNMFYKQPTRYTNPTQVLWNAAAEYGKGITDPNIEHHDALFNAAVNLAPLGMGSRLAKMTTGVGGEMVEVDNSQEDGIGQLWGIMK